MGRAERTGYRLDALSNAPRCDEAHGILTADQDSLLARTDLNSSDAGCLADKAAL